LLLTDEHMHEDSAVESIVNKPDNTSSASRKKYT
jgi:hypothetical protein